MYLYEPEHCDHPLNELVEDENQAGPFIRWFHCKQCGSKLLRHRDPKLPYKGGVE